MAKRIDYIGSNTTEGIAQFMEKCSAGGYAFYVVMFGEVFVYTSKKLPTGAHAPSDYPKGYWRDGKHSPWSQARITKDQNTGIIEG